MKFPLSMSVYEINAKNKFDTQIEMKSVFEKINGSHLKAPGRFIL